MCITLRTGGIMDMGLFSLDFYLIEIHRINIIHRKGIRVYNDYGLVTKAASRYKTPLPIYQKSNDVITRDQLIPIGNEDGDDQFYEKENYVKPTNWYSDPGRALYAAGHQRTAFYYNPNNGKYYQKTWDLNDYGGSGFFGTNPFGLGDLLDKIGNPVVVTSGF